MAESAVLLMAHGSPDSVDEMEEFLGRVMTRRPPTPQFVAEMQDRYRQIGGRSPLPDITRAQAKALAAKLGVPVYVGMRCWRPFIAEAVEEARRDGVRRLVGIALAPHFSPVSIGAYHRALLEARGEMDLVLVDSWAVEPHLIDLWAARLSPGATVLFTAHSVPVEGAGAYPEEVRATVRAILDRVNVRALDTAPGPTPLTPGRPAEPDGPPRGPQPEGLLPDVKGQDRPAGGGAPRSGTAPSQGRAHFAYQSRSPSPVPWLGPDVSEVLPSLRGQEVLVAPIGFVCDHVEVLYDLDILHRRQAEALGIRWRRLPMPNAEPLLIEALAGVARPHLV